jgi:uncharacterized coiled-coil protein SlyX
MTEQQNVCKGSIHLGTGCKRCSKCAEELTKEVERLNKWITDAKEIWSGYDEYRLKLESTNAAQAEQLAKLNPILTQLSGMWNQHPEDVKALLMEHGDMAKALNNLSTLLQSSSPPEPQATVELTDDEVRAAFIEAHGGDAAYYDSHGYEIRWTTRIVQRALNQRQAVKAEPQKVPASEYQLLRTVFEHARSFLRYNGIDKARVHAAVDSLDAAVEAVKDFDGGAEPLSAAQGVPEGMAGKFYLQNSQGTVGNEMMWWGLDGRGYTTNLNKAHLFTEDEALTQQRCRATDIPWPAEYVRSHAHPSVTNGALWDAAPEQAESKEGKNHDGQK